MNEELVRRLLDKDQIVIGGLLYCVPVMREAAAALSRSDLLPGLREALNCCLPGSQSASEVRKRFRELEAQSAKNSSAPQVAQTVRASGKSAAAEDTEGRGFESHQPAAADLPLGIALDAFEAELGERMNP